MSGGIINLPAGILQKPSSQPPNTPSKPAGRRKDHPRLKLLVRRLPPGLTEAEFVSHLGPEWKAGSGKVSNLIYRPGKIAKDLTKLSRESRAYLVVMEDAHVTALSDKVRQTTFQDAKNTSKDPALLGPPIVELSPYSRVPAARKRKDARQGTIDQDPDFIMFLEALTMPVQKPAAELDSAAHKDEKVTTTPLIEHIREKKALKEKNAAKASKRGEARDAAKRKGKQSVVATPPEKPKKSSRPTKETPKIISKPSTTATNAVSSTETTTTTTANPQAERKRVRPGAFNLAAKIQGDLGIAPAKRASREAKIPTDNATAEQSTEIASDKSGETAPPSGPSTPRKESRTRDRRPRTGSGRGTAEKTTDSPNLIPATPPTILKKSATTQTPKTVAASTNAQDVKLSPTIKPPSAPAVKSTRAFLKHANPSQGITEELLKTALSTYGTVTNVEIDKRKGIAFADFADSAGLAAAIAKGKIEVAQGAVQVLEYKERNPRAGPASRVPSIGGSPPINPRGGPADATRGRLPFRGRGRGRGGGAAPTAPASSGPPASVPTAPSNPST